VKRKKAKAEHTFKSAEAFAEKLQDLHSTRTALKARDRPPRAFLTQESRRAILGKTNKRCHIRGGHFTRKRRAQIDHVVAHSAGGLGEDGNYLAAHKDCNKTRWHFGPEEWRYILQLGVFARHRIEKLRGTLGRDIAEAFINKEGGRIRRNEARRKRARAVGRAAS
jgi:hypothetical protein